MHTVSLSPYSAVWPDVFEQARDELVAVMSPLDVGIEHIGSTSVPGLAAKPVLDMLLGVDCLRQVEMRIGSLARLGYDYIPRYERQLPERRYFVRASIASLRVHLHAVARGGLYWREHLAFRDALREDAWLRSEYQKLKLGLAARFALDKSAYQAAKAPFIRSALAGLSK